MKPYAVYFCAAYGYSLVFDNWFDLGAHNRRWLPVYSVRAGRVVETCRDWKAGTRRWPQTPMRRVEADNLGNMAADYFVVFNHVTMRLCTPRDVAGGDITDRCGDQCFWDAVFAASAIQDL